MITPKVPLRRDLSLAEVGDALRFCRTCAFSLVCLESGLDKPQLKELKVHIGHSDPFARGSHVFREGDPFNMITVVRTGAVKTRVMSRDGREQVLGFFLPGEVIGLNAIADERYPCDVVALEDTVLCQLSFPAITDLAGKAPAVQSRLFALLSQDIGKAMLLSGDFSARERLIAFILSLSRRNAARGQSAQRLRLPMAWSDVASHLRLAPETISRLIKSLQAEKLVRIDRREVTILDAPALQAQSVNILRNQGPPEQRPRPA